MASNTFGKALSWILVSHIVCACASSSAVIGSFTFLCFFFSLAINLSAKVVTRSSLGRLENLFQSRSSGVPLVQLSSLLTRLTSNITLPDFVSELMPCSVYLFISFFEASVKQSSVYLAVSSEVLINLGICTLSISWRS